MALRWFYCFSDSEGETVHAMLRALLCLSLLACLTPRPCLADETAIQRAVKFLETACVNTGKHQKFEVEGGVDASWRGLTKSLAQGKARYTQEEIEGLGDSLNAFSSQQASEARRCMQPYIKRILDLILFDATPRSEGLSEAEAGQWRSCLLRNGERIAQALVHTTHPSGRYLDSYKPTFSPSPDGTRLDAEFTVNWKGLFLRHTTVFLVGVAKDGRVALHIVSDTAQIKIAAENLRTATSSVEKILRQ